MTIPRRSSHLRTLQGFAHTSVCDGLEGGLGAALGRDAEGLVVEDEVGELGAAAATAVGARDGAGEAGGSEGQDSGGEGGGDANHGCGDARQIAIRNVKEC